MIPDKKYVVIISDPIEQEKEDIANNLRINNQDIYITENGTYLPAEGYTGIGRATVNVAGTTPIIESLNITPETEAQTFNPLEGVNGFAPVSVAAVTAAIDSNISANNIKTGVSILGVSGNVVELKGETKTISPTTSQQTITPTTPTYNGLTSVTVNAVTSSIDNNISAGNIKNGVTILGVTGNYSGSGANIDSLSITPTTSQQTITASGGIDGYSPITVSAVTSSIDANIIAGNIKNGVTILGVTGNYTGGTDLSRDFMISNGLLKSDTNGHLMNFTGVTNIDNSILRGAYENNVVITGTIDMSDLTTLSNGFACYHAFSNCIGITSVNLSSLTTVSASNACNAMFQGCTGITSININSLTTVSDSTACSNMFQNCTGLTNINISSLTTITGNNGCSFMFSGCKNLTSVVFNSLSTITGSSCLAQMFSRCNNLTSLSFPALTSNSFGTNVNQINNIISYVTDCTIHFPSNLDPQGGSTVISSLTGYPDFGGTNTVLSFDLPATT